MSQTTRHKNSKTKAINMAIVMFDLLSMCFEFFSKCFDAQKIWFFLNSHSLERKCF